MKLGFSTGSLHKHFSAKEALRFFQNLGHDTVEIGLVKMARVTDGWADEIEIEDLKGFQYISLHAPVIDYGDNDETKLVFEKIERINKLRKLDAVVIHPNTVKDFSVFHGLQFPIALENMDNRKDSYVTPEEFEKLLKDNPNWKFVLDVNHVYTHDKSMGLAKEFYSTFGNRIEEIHLSGYEGYHEPLFRTKQLEILSAIQNFDTPIIIEAVMEPEEIEKERNYVIEQIEKLS